MDNKSILLIVLLVFLIFNMFYLCKQSRENFSDTKYTSQNLIDMFNSLEVAEKRCEELEERRNLKDEKEKIKINEATFNELEELDKKILELKEILKDLTLDKKRKDSMTNKCRANKQISLNRNYDLIKKLDKSGFTKDDSIDLDLNISDSLNLNFGNKNKDSEKGVKCSVKNPKYYVNVDKEDISGKCHNCDVSKLKPNYPYLNKDFGR